MEYSFEKLRVWQEARVLVKEVYVLMNSFPKVEQYALCDQIRRAVISVASNIAEGNSKKTPKERLHFFDIAFGSLMEVYCQLILSNDLQYISTEQLDSIRPRINSVSQMLSGLKVSIESKL